MRTRRGASVSDVGLATCRYVFKRLAHACQSVNLHVFCSAAVDPETQIRDPLKQSNQGLARAPSHTSARAPQGSAIGQFRGRHC